MKPTFASDPEQALAFFRENGYHIEPGVRTPEEIARLTRASEQLESFRDGTFLTVLNPHRLDPVFLTAMKHAGIVRILKRVLGERVSGLQSQFFHGKPGSVGFYPHQDNYYVEAARDAFVSVWSPLVDVSRANGTLIVYPGSQRESILPVQRHEQALDPSQDRNAQLNETVIPDRYQPVDVIASAGDIVLVHGFIVHASHPNTSAGFRRVLLTTYIRCGEKFRAGFSAGRAEIDLEIP